MTESEDRLLARAQKLRARGVAEHNAGRPLQALTLFRKGIALLDRLDTDDRKVAHTRLSVNAASSESELRGLDAGLMLLADVQTYVDQTQDPVVGVYLHLGIGYMRARGGQFEAGLHHLDEAVRLLGHADAAAQTNILMNRGMTNLFLGRISQARRDYVRAIALAREHQLLLEEAKLTHNLGEIEFYAGNLAAALELMDSSARLGADWSVAVTLVDRARVLLEAGLHTEADEALQEAGQLFRQARLFKDVAEVELFRAECALRDSEVSAARRLAAQARDRFRRRRNDAGRRNAELVLLQADLAAGRPGRRIAPPAHRLAAEFSALGRHGQARAAQLIEAEAVLHSGRPEAAAALVPAPAAEDSVSVRLQTQFLRAGIAHQLGDTRAARSHVRRGLAELSAYQSRFGSIDLQTASAIHGRRLAELDLQIAFEADDPAAAVEAVERARASSSRLVPVRQQADEQTTALLVELRQAVDDAREVRATAQSAETVAGRERRVAELQRSLRSRAWTNPGSGAAREPARVGEIRSALAAGSASLLCFAQIGDELSVIVQQADMARIHTLGSAAEVSELLRRLRADLDVLANGRVAAALAEAVRSSMRRSLHRLEAILLQPLRLGDERLVIVPTGPLATLAWNLLPALAGRAVTVAPSATAWLSASRPAERTGPPRVAAFAGPDLARSVEEVRDIGAIWGPGTRVAERAEPNDLVAALAEATLVHVAAHGNHQPENPLFSSIRLSAGPVFAYELDQHPTVAEHVVLSACELGQATIRPGDEALGLTSVLLHLGSRSVISGVARVHDDVAAEVMPRYHRALVAGRDSAQALAEACAARSDVPAPFVCFGASWTA